MMGRSQPWPGLLVGAGMPSGGLGWDAWPSAACISLRIKAEHSEEGAASSCISRVASERSRDGRGGGDASAERVAARHSGSGDGLAWEGPRVGAAEKVLMV